MTEEELDAAVDVIAAVDAGVLQSLNQRVKARNKKSKIFLPRIPGLTDPGAERSAQSIFLSSRLLLLGLYNINFDDTSFSCNWNSLTIDRGLISPTNVY